MTRFIWVNTFLFNSICISYFYSLDFLYEYAMYNVMSRKKHWMKRCVITSRNYLSIIWSKCLKEWIKSICSQGVASQWEGSTTPVLTRLGLWQWTKRPVSETSADLRNKNQLMIVWADGSGTNRQMKWAQQIFTEPEVVRSTDQNLLRASEHLNTELSAPGTETTTERKAHGQCFWSLTRVARLLHWFPSKKHFNSYSLSL